MSAPTSALSVCCAVRRLSLLPLWSQCHTAPSRLGRTLARRLLSKGPVCPLHTIRIICFFIQSFFLLLGIQPIILFVGPHKQNNYCFLSVFTCTDVGRLAVARQYVTWSRVYTASCTWLTPLAAAAPHTIYSTPAVSRCSSYCDASSDTLCEWTIALLETAVGVVSVSNNFILRASDLNSEYCFQAFAFFVSIGRRPSAWFPV